MSELKPCSMNNIKRNALIKNQLSFKFYEKSD